MKESRYLSVLSFCFAVAFLLAACDGAAVTPTSIPTATPGPAVTSEPNPFASVSAIVNPNNFSYPREVLSANGSKVSIKAKPQRVMSLTVGHDEMTFAIIPISRVVGVSSTTKTAAFSNVADVAKDIPTVARDPESILALRPDVIFTSQLFPAAIVTSLTAAGVAVVQVELKNDPKDRVNQILLAGYVYGEEQRALQFAQEVDARVQAVSNVVKNKAASAKQRVASVTSFDGKVYTAGKNSTEGGIIEGAGGINTAAEAGLERNPVISYESLIAMKPDVIIVTQPEDSGAPFVQSLLANQTLAEVPAVKNKRVYLVDSLHFTTLSYYNVRGIEDLASILWQAEFQGKVYPPFSKPKA